MGFIKKAVDFFSTPTHSRTMGVLVMLVLTSAIFLTVIVAQQQQTMKQLATSATCSSQGGTCISSSYCTTSNGLQTISATDCSLPSVCCKGTSTTAPSTGCKKDSSTYFVCVETINGANVSKGTDYCSGDKGYSYNCSNNTCQLSILGCPSGWKCSMGTSGPPTCIVSAASTSTTTATTTTGACETNGGGICTPVSKACKDAVSGANYVYGGYGTSGTPYSCATSDKPQCCVPPASTTCTKNGITCTDNTGSLTDHCVGDTRVIFSCNSSKKCQTSVGGMCTGQTCSMESGVPTCVDSTTTIATCPANGGGCRYAGCQSTETEISGSCPASYVCCKTTTTSSTTCTAANQSTTCNDNNSCTNDICANGTCNNTTYVAAKTGTCTTVNGQTSTCNGSGGCSPTCSQSENTCTDGDGTVHQDSCGTLDANGETPGHRLVLQ